MSTHLEFFRSPLAGPVAIFSARPRATRYLLGILAIGVAYCASAKLGQTLGYTASVAAIWPPAGLGIAVLYLPGLGCADQIGATLSVVSAPGEGTLVRVDVPLATEASTDAAG